MKRKLTKAKKVTVHKKRAFKPQTGKISKGVIFGIAAAVVVIGAGAFFFLNKGAGTSSPLAGIVKAPLNPNCEYNDPELCKFLNNWQSLSDYTVTSTSQVEGATVESVFRLSGQDKSEMISKQNGKESYHTISIGDTTYTLDITDNKWWKYTYKPVEGQASAEEETKEQLDFDAPEKKDTTQYKFIAKEACGDLMCFKYEVVTQGSEFKEFIYFDDKEYLLRKMRTESANGEVNESLFSYDKVSISEPSPVKEGDPYSTGAGAGANMSEEEVNKMMQEYQQMQTDTPQDQPSDEY